MELSEHVYFNILVNFLVDADSTLKLVFLIYLLFVS